MSSAPNGGQSPVVCVFDAPEAPLTAWDREMLAESRRCVTCPNRVRPDPMPDLSTTTWCFGTHRSGWTHQRMSLDFFERGRDGLLSK